MARWVIYPRGFRYKGIEGKRSSLVLEHWRELRGGRDRIENESREIAARLTSLEASATAGRRGGFGVTGALGSRGFGVRALGSGLDFCLWINLKEQKSRSTPRLHKIRSVRIAASAAFRTPELPLLPIHHILWRLAIGLASPTIVRTIAFALAHAHAVFPTPCLGCTRAPVVRIGALSRGLNCLSVLPKGAPHNDTCRRID